MTHERVTQIIAHRGDSGHGPENTLAAFRQAVQLGADGVELDLHRAADGVPVVIHDHTLERTTSGLGRVEDHTSTELAALDAGSWFGADFSAEGIPTLASVLGLLGPTGMILHLELKTGDGPDPLLVETVLALLAGAEASFPGLGERIVMSSFQHDNLKAVLQRSPGLSCAALVDKEASRPWESALALGCQGLHPPWESVDEAMVRYSHEAGLAIRPWTVDDPEVAAHLMDWGVDGIITNQPGPLLAVRRLGSDPAWEGA